MSDTAIVDEFAPLEQHFEQRHNEESLLQNLQFCENPK